MIKLKNLFLSAVLLLSLNAICASNIVDFEQEEQFFDAPEYQDAAEIVDLDDESIDTALVPTPALRSSSEAWGLSMDSSGIEIIDEFSVKQRALSVINKLARFTQRHPNLLLLVGLSLVIAPVTADYVYKKDFSIDNNAKILTNDIIDIIKYKLDIEYNSTYAKELVDKIFTDHIKRQIAKVMQTEALIPYYCQPIIRFLDCRDYCSSHCSLHCPMNGFGRF